MEEAAAALSCIPKFTIGDALRKTIVCVVLRFFSSFIFVPVSGVVCAVRHLLLLHVGFFFSTLEF